MPYRQNILAGALLITLAGILALRSQASLTTASPEAATIGSGTRP